METWCQAIRASLVDSTMAAELAVWYTRGQESNEGRTVESAVLLGTLSCLEYQISFLHSHRI